MTGAELGEGGTLRVLLEHRGETLELTMETEGW